MWKKTILKSSLFSPLHWDKLQLFPKTYPSFLLFIRTLFPTTCHSFLLFIGTNSSCLLQLVTLFSCSLGQTVVVSYNLSLFSPVYWDKLQLFPTTCPSFNCTMGQTVVVSYNLSLFSSVHWDKQQLFPTTCPSFNCTMGQTVVVSYNLLSFQNKICQFSQKMSYLIFSDSTLIRDNLLT